MNSSLLTGLLADTWWFGLTKRMTEQMFKNLAQLRAEQGFSAIQLVVGIPPEVGPENENACSEVGFPWTLKGNFNQAYLDLAYQRIRYLNSLGLTGIVYGAWGHQIQWLGLERMIAWWERIIQTLDTLQVIYCLSGESNLWIGEEARLLPDRSTDHLAQSQSITIRQWLPPKVRGVLGRIKRNLIRLRYKSQLEERRRAWSLVLEKISHRTNRPIIIHPVATETGYEAVCNPELLAANTAQTGHDLSAKNRLWQLPLAWTRSEHCHKGFINLEPWYEGIRDQFWAEDQLYAYWVSMLAGAVSHCYGAHGVWNVGDGRFLAHWGRQTFAQATALDTPRLLGLSHLQMLLRGDQDGEPFYHTVGDQLLTIGRKAGQKIIQFFPDVAQADQVPAGKIWLPLKGRFTDRLPSTGPAVIFVD